MAIFEKIFIANASCVRTKLIETFPERLQCFDTINGWSLRVFREHVISNGMYTFIHILFANLLSHRQFDMPSVGEAIDIFKNPGKADRYPPYMSWMRLQNCLFLPIIRKSPIPIYFYNRAMKHDVALITIPLGKISCYRSRMDPIAFVSQEIYKLVQCFQPQIYVNIDGEDTLTSMNHKDYRSFKRLRDALYTALLDAEDSSYKENQNAQKVKSASIAHLQDINRWVYFLVFHQNIFQYGHLTEISYEGLLKAYVEGIETIFPQALSTATEYWLHLIVSTYGIVPCNFYPLDAPSLDTASKVAFQESRHWNRPSFISGTPYTTLKESITYTQRRILSPFGYNISLTNSEGQFDPTHFKDCLIFLGKQFFQKYARFSEVHGTALSCNLLNAFRNR